MTIEEIIADLEDRGFKVRTNLYHPINEPVKYRVTVNHPICDYMTADELKTWYHMLTEVKCV